MSKKSLNIIGQEISRRDFLKGMGAAAAAGAIGCADSPKQTILPNVKGDEAQIPGVAQWYKSTCMECDAGCGVMHRNYEGRVVKIEGNPEHPVNRGGLCAIGHSALQAHYDPDRVRQPLEKVKEGNKEIFKPVSWETAYSRIQNALKKQGKKAFLSASLNGTLDSLVQKWTEALEIEHAAYNPLDSVALAKATKAVYGTEKEGIPGYDFAKADVVINFGADFLETWISPCGFAKDWAQSRKGKHPVRVFHVEPRLSLTGANADHWLNCEPGSEIYIAALILKEISGKEVIDGLDYATVSEKTGVKVDKIVTAIAYLKEAKHPLVIAGGASGNTEKEFELQAVCALLNRELGAVGDTVKLDELRAVKTDLQKYAEIIAEMNTGKYTVCFVDNSNPLFTLPAASKLKWALKKLDLLVSFSSHIDETTKQADLILPASTSIEAWNDNQPYEGVYSLVQPAMTPIFDTKDFGDILLGIAGDTDLKKYATWKDYLQEAWKEIYNLAEEKEGTFEKFWKVSVERGGYFSSKKKTIALGAVDEAVFSKKFKAPALKKESELVLLPYASVKTFDGRAANRPWMQEIPDPMTQIVWDSWAEIHPDTAKKYGIKTGDPVKVSNYYGELNVPAYLTEHVKEGVVAVPVGNGHSEYGRYASSVGGGNVYDLLSLKEDQAGLALLSASVKIKRGRGNYNLVMTQITDQQGKREIARTRAIKETHGHNEEHGEHHGGHHETPQMYEQREHPLYNWGMAVDLAACTGCSACVAACYAENNIPTVGKDIVGQGREMSWLSIQRYDDGGSEDLQVSFLPMMCQHCNSAPCEPVCPVYATYHNEEGLNVMTYNRCVGTRYCGNNCVYKVRRFNWFQFDFPEPLNLQLNPDVMKRDAGVMEKCSFCVQRITAAKDTAKDEGRLVKDGEVQPACVQSCPTEALVFGDLNDPNSKVSKMAKSERSYKILDHHLNTQPSVSYLDNLKYKI